MGREKRGGNPKKSVEELALEKAFKP